MQKLLTTHLNKLIIAGVIILAAVITLLASQVWLTYFPAKSTTEYSSDSEPAFESIIMTGSGSAISPTFTVPADEWAVQWTYRPGDQDRGAFYLHIIRVGENQTLVNSIIAPDKKDGVIHCRGSGQYYIQIGPSTVKIWKFIIRAP